MTCDVTSRHVSPPHSRGRVLTSCHTLCRLLFWPRLLIICVVSASLFSLPPVRVSATHLHGRVRRDVPLPHLRGGVHGRGDPKRRRPQDGGEEETALRQRGGYGHSQVQGEAQSSRPPPRLSSWKPMGSSGSQTYPQSGNLNYLLTFVYILTSRRCYRAHPWSRSFQECFSQARTCVLLLTFDIIVRPCQSRKSPKRVCVCTSRLFWTPVYFVRYMKWMYQSWSRNRKEVTHEWFVFYSISLPTHFLLRQLVLLSVSNASRV